MATLRIVAMLTLLASGPLLACDSVPRAADEWFKASHADVAVSKPGDAETYRFTFDIAPNGDLRIAASGARDGSGRGTLMLVSGALLVKDLALNAGEEIDAIDAPVLLLQLTNKLLAEATRKAPAAVKGKLAIDMKEGTRPICAATPSAEAAYPAPWTLRGTVESMSAGIVDFSLRFHSGAGEQAQDLLYAGRWARAGEPVAFADAMSLAGWRVFNLGPIRRTEGASTILDYGATADAKSYATLGDLRAAQKARAPAAHRLPNH